MRTTYLALGTAGILGVFAACSGDGPAAPIDTGSGNRTGSAGKKSSPGTSGKSNTDDVGGAGGDGETSTGGTGFTRAGSNGAGGNTQSGDAPVVKVISPKASPTPDDGALIDQTVKVTCTVAKSSAPNAAAIDPTTVRLALLDSTGKVIEEKGATATANENEYSADFVLTTVPAGKVAFQCSARDKDMVMGTDKLSTYVDHGPTITVIEPVPDSAHPLKGGLSVQFSVAASTLATDDAGAAIDDVHFTFDGKPFDLKEASPGKYQVDLALDDTGTFPEVPSGAITITATNKRAPKPAASDKSYSIVIDGTGPIISIEAPAPQAVVGGKIALVFNVTDQGSGVDSKSVYVTRFPGDAPQFFNPLQGWSQAGNKYTYSFDSKSIESDAPVQTTVNVRASDKVGNPSASGQSVQLYLDNVPPQIDLDPLNVRTRAGNTCSGSFDPVGPAPLNDLAGQLGLPFGLPRIAWFRAFVWERTNSQPGQSIFYTSGTNQQEVRLYVQPDPASATTKLLINKNPGTDTTCDDIGGVDALVNPPLFTALKGLPKSGAVSNQDFGDTTPALGTCPTYGGPDRIGLCPSHGSDMWYVAYNDQLNEPAVYVVGSPNPADVSCNGIDLAFITPNQPEGWVCIAARVVDRAGNVGISPPLRVCVDDPETAAQPDCRVMSTEPPTCTDGCIPPARGGNFVIRTQ